MNLKASTRFLLVLLQLAIGWHLFYEGAWKLNNPSWSSKGYLKNATGPLEHQFRWVAGDPEVWKDPQPTEEERAADLKERLTPLPATLANENPAEPKLHERMPTHVKADWDDYYQRFVKHYKLDQEENRSLGAQVEAAYKKSQDGFVQWLIDGTMMVKRPNFSTPGPVPVRVRLAEYLAKLDEVKALGPQEDGTFTILDKPKGKKAQDEAVVMRKELAAELDARFDEMKGTLRDGITYEQRRMADVPAPKYEPADPTSAWERVDAAARSGELLWWVDQKVKWGLLIVGGLLLLGLFTRTACVLGAVLLLSFYLAMPPFPWLPEAAASEGHFMFVNKNLIEILALLALATTQPGRRFGLDVWVGAVLKKMFPPKQKPTAAPSRPTAAATTPTNRS
jgi:uncharacterized membrane protein YphA (DoxX/SURF4 family)